MSLWIQHGYGKSDKIDRISSQDAAVGVILSSGDEEVDNLARTVAHVRSLGLNVLLDPQTYIYSIPDGVAVRHASHGLEFGPTHWSLAPADVQRHVQAVIDANVKLGIEEPIIGPTCLQRGFGDVWSPLALQYARSAISSIGGENLYVTLAMDEAGLRDWGPIEEWLDLVTTLDVQGFYVVICKASSTYPYIWDATRLTNLLRLFYRLAEFNEYQVIWGYSDFEGLLGLAVGCSGICSGWHHGLRLLCETKWQPNPSVQRQPVPRVTSPSLLTPLKAIGEADAILETPFAEAIFPDRELRDRLAETDAAAWTRADAHVQHLVELGRIAGAISSIPDVPARVLSTQERLADARTLLGRLEMSGVVLPTIYRTRVDQLLLSLDSFAMEEGM
jgi:hypothetical protein